MKCSNCGYRIPKDAPRCPNCGLKINVEMIDEDNSVEVENKQSTSVSVVKKKKKEKISLVPSDVEITKSDEEPPVSLDEENSDTADDNQAKIEQEGEEQSAVPVLTKHDGQQKIEVISATRKPIEKEKKKMSPTVIVIIVVAVVLVVAIITGVTIKKKKNEKAKIEQQSTIDESIKNEENNHTVSNVVMPPDVSVEFTTGSQMNEFELEYNNPGDTPNNNSNSNSNSSSTAKTKPMVETQISNIPTNSDQAILDKIKGFLSGTFYIDGIMYSDNGEGTALTMAVSGDNFEMMSDFEEGKKIGILRMDNKVYMKDPDQKQYVEMSNSLMKMMGLNLDDMQIDFGSTDFDCKTPSSVTQGTYGGQKSTVYTFSNGSNSMVKFTAVNGEIKEIVTDSGMKIQMDAFSVTPPSTMLTVNGFKKVGFMEFFKNMM